MEGQNYKPKVSFKGENGNVFHLLSLCTAALKEAKSPELVNELTEKIFKAKSYANALSIMTEYCDIDEQPKI